MGERKSVCMCSAFNVTVKLERQDEMSKEG